ncbi:LacI family DNA-binding transcriptional regulator [uncultured Alsobacter sp.]|uniref:LacI family DNA-binding transcriptional regulator n=1 Tax=uncultured Alsobacter sp. TaxID=1748258 RepID=UPI002600E048|nr:LacI family DNA-binding transcriptional regulator [uncultured Alsobacter sp.]
MDGTDGKHRAERPAGRRSRSTGHVRIEDVARAANVSAQTVSRYFRHPGSVSAPTADKIRASIAATGYVPNLVAGSLASNRSRIIAVIVPTVANPVHATQVQGLSDAVRAEGYQVFVGTTDYDRDTEHRLVETFLGRRVDGIVLVGAHLRQDTVDLLKRSGLPTVQVWELPENPVDMVVGHSNYEIGRTVARHLLERGRKRFAIIAHAAVTDTRAAARVHGFREVLAAAGVKAPAIIEVARPNDMTATPELLARLLRMRPKPDAIFCVNDPLAVGLVLACHRAGVRVPQDLAIAGVGDSDLAAMVTPAITTVRIPRYELGQTAGTMLMERLAGTGPARSVVDLGFKLVVRQST